MDGHLTEINIDGWERLLSCSGLKKAAANDDDYNDINR